MSKPINAGDQLEAIKRKLLTRIAWTTTEVLELLSCLGDTLASRPAEVWPGLKVKATGRTFKCIHQKASGAKCTACDRERGMRALPVGWKRGSSWEADWPSFVHVSGAKVESPTLDKWLWWPAHDSEGACPNPTQNIADAMRCALLLPVDAKL
jgi:hypothetical protein